jgi:hypothetical protein
LLDTVGSQVNEFKQCHITGKYPFVLGYFPDLAMVTFNGIGGIYQFADTGRVFKISA